MTVLKSLSERKLITTFFVIAYTFAILSFSVGNSALEQQRLRVNYNKPENNKVISFKNCNTYTLLDLVELIKNENITLEVYKTISLNKSENFILSTSFINKGLQPFVDMKDGSYFNKDDFESDSKLAVFSSTVDINNNKFNFKSVQDSGNIKNVELVGKGISTERTAKVIVPQKLFLECEKNINLSNESIVFKLNGNEMDVDRAAKKVGDKFKEKSKQAMVSVSPLIINDDSYESQSLFKMTLAIILIIILNSINISALWIERRKKEIILRKVFGATNRNIFNILFGELTIIALISMIIALLIQFILVKAGNAHILNINITLYKSNFYFGLILAIATAYLSALPIYVYLSKIQPAKELMEE